MITKNIGGFKMLLNPKDRGISSHLAKKGSREECFMWVLAREATGDLGLDVGANIGYTTLHLCKAMKKVIAIEPDPRSLKLLKKNIKLNNYSGSTEIHSFAISDVNGTATICLANKPNLSTLSIKARKEGAKIVGKNETIKTKTIDSLGVLPNFIKMDIEGFEVEALRGAMESLRKTPNCKILIEVHPQFYDGDSFETVLKQLSGIGFRAKYIVSAGVPQPDLFKKNGYEPMPGAPINRRAVYNCISQEHAIKWASHSIKQVCRNGKVSPKIVRSILLVK